MLTATVLAVSAFTSTSVTHAASTPTPTTTSASGPDIVNGVPQQMQVNGTWVKPAYGIVAAPGQPILTEPETLATPSSAKAVATGGKPLGKTTLEPYCYQPTAALRAQAEKDPTSITAAQAAIYGLPPLNPFTAANPNDGKNIATWLRIVEHDTYRTCSSTEDPGIKNGINKTDVAKSQQAQNRALNFHGPYWDCNTCSGSGSYPQNVGWSGFWASESGSAYWEYSQTEWVIPTVQGSQPGFWPDQDDLADWGGIGDPATACQLIQTGTDSEATIYTGFWTASYDAWWEDVCDTGDPYQQIINFTYGVQPGDDMIAEVWPGGTIDLCDLSANGGNGECGGFADPNFPTDGHTFMCIQEQPTGIPEPSGLSTTYFTQCEGEDSTGHYHPVGVNEFAWGGAYLENDYIDSEPTSAYRWQPCTSIGSCGSYGGFDMQASGLG